MKYILSLIFLSFLCIGLKAQHQILNIRIEPKNPTSDDKISVIVDLQFTSGSCIRDVVSHQVNGNTIISNSHYCVGPLTVICPASDTFALGNLLPGNYTFHSNLTSGGLPTPCTPGIVPNDMDSTMFTVTQVMNVESFKSRGIQILPTAVQGTVELNLEDGWRGSILSVYSLEGKLMYQRKITTNRELLKVNSAPGIYLLKIENSEESYVKRIVL